MKKICIIIIICALLFQPSPVRADNTEQINYMEIMIMAAVSGDLETGRAAAKARDAKIVSLNLVDKYRIVAFEDLYLLSKIMYAEAGSYWLPNDWKMAVGEVVLNRVASPEFPNTIAEVLAQPGQYYGQNSSYFYNLRPSEICVRLAVRLLNGERNLHPAVVFQANFTQGSGVYTAYYDRYLGWTYFCLSSRPGLYQAA